MVALTDGQRLAFRQLSDIAARSFGSLEILGEPELSTSTDWILIRISVETREFRQPMGLPLRDRERLLVFVPSDFPFRSPSVHFDHRRFEGTAHVQWGRSICLYQSVDTEYEPSDGMFGFVERLRVWLEAAGRGELDAEDAPLHPPAVYTTSSNQFVIRADAPRMGPDQSIWLGRANLTNPRDGRYDIEGWTGFDAWSLEESPSITAGAILFSKPLPMEYPSKILDLLDAIENAGMSFSFLVSVLKLIAVLTPEGAPAFIVLGAPMRRRAAGEPLRPHLTVWEIAADTMASLRAFIRAQDGDTLARDALAEWMATADVAWCQVLEDRPEVTHRRDHESPLSNVAGKRVLLLGCGALGSAIAESVVRAGASAAHLVDSGRVKPGLLVRQRFADPDIGLPKSDALKAHLDAIGLRCQVTSERADLSVAALTRFAPDAFDLVIDATASAPVGRRLEEELKTVALPIPMIALTVSANAAHGCVTVRMPDYGGGPQTLARQAKLELFARHAGHSLIRAFWPAKDEQNIFQPEPGCSAPTFLGSAADIDHFAALINLGLVRAQTLSASQSSIDLVAAPWLMRPTREMPQIGAQFEHRARLTEQHHGYTVWQSSVALQSISSELRRLGRLRADRNETGGLIFGEIDEAHRYIYVDDVSGPPPDSQSSPDKFLCGVSGTRELAEHHRRRSDGSSGFIGIWHTHPISQGRPSTDDLLAMVNLLHLQPYPPRHVVMLIVGYSASDPQLNYYLYHRDEFEVVRIEPIEENPA